MGAGGIRKTLEERISRRKSTPDGFELCRGHRVRAGDMQSQPEEAPEGSGRGEIQGDLPGDHRGPTEEKRPGKV